MLKQICLVTIALSAHAASFEVASVKPNTVGMPTDNREAKQKIAFEPGRVTMVNVPMVECIAAAYKVPEYEVSGPAWMKTARFDIEAKAGGAASSEQMRPMVQSLLAERFHLRLHPAQQEMATYAVTVGPRGHKLKRSAQEGSPAMELVGGAVEYRNFSVDRFAASLSAPPFHLPRPVVNNTGLEGQYDFALTVAPDSLGMKHAFESALSDSADAPSVFTLIQEQLGLKMTARKERVQVLVVDSCDKEPSAN